MCRGYLSLALWRLGYPDQALARNRELLRLVQELSDSYGLGWALVTAAMFHHFHREAQLTLERAEAALTLSTTQGFALWLAWSTILRGWALAERGQQQEGVVQLQHGLAAYRATGGETFLSWWLGLLAEAYGKAGQAEAGLATVTEALEFVDRTEERFHEAELHRLKGELVLQSGVHSPGFKVEEETEACFHKALAVARQQQAKSWELRAATSLARLWQQQGKTTDARELLVPVHNWFTEGFDTADLKDAKALLHELT